MGLKWLKQKTGRGSARWSWWFQLGSTSTNLFNTDEHGLDFQKFNVDLIHLNGLDFKSKFNLIKSGHILYKTNLNFLDPF